MFLPGQVPEEFSAIRACHLGIVPHLHTLEGGRVRGCRASLIQYAKQEDEETEVLQFFKAPGQFNLVI